MSKVVSLNSFHNLVKPFSCTLTGGYFDLFHVGHLRYLKECSKYGKPFVVVVLSDRCAKIIKGPDRPIVNENDRAEIIASLEFVDYVIITDDHPFRSDIFEKILPKEVVLCRENMESRTVREKDIISKYNQVSFHYIKRQVNKSSTSEIIKRIENGFNYDNIKEPIIKELLKTASNSKVNTGKIGAVIVKGEKILCSTPNTETHHAEINAIKSAKKENIDIYESEIYISIPPCSNCAEEIIKAGIKRVFYLQEYGLNDGRKILEENNVKMNEYKEKL